jgi:hypothetical protein
MECVIFKTNRNVLMDTNVLNTCSFMDWKKQYRPNVTQVILTILYSFLFDDCVLISTSIWSTTVLIWEEDYNSMTICCSFN